jgi:hypothetical protein
LKELQSTPNGLRRLNQALIEITPSQRNFVCAKFILSIGLFAFPGQRD